jgi:hypothetical protein
MNKFQRVLYMIYYKFKTFLYSLYFNQLRSILILLKISIKNEQGLSTDLNQS